MADSAKRESFVAEISLLRKQQLESFENGAFFGGTDEAKAAHDKRAGSIKLLLHRLAELDATP